MLPSSPHRMGLCIDTVVFRLTVLAGVHRRQCIILAPHCGCDNAGLISLLAGCWKTRFGSRKPTSGAKARPTLEGLAARLKSCPSQNLFEAEFFSSLFKSCPSRNLYHTRNLVYRSRANLCSAKVWAGTNGKGTSLLVPSKLRGNRASAPEVSC